TAAARALAAQATTRAAGCNADAADLVEGRLGIARSTALEQVGQIALAALGADDAEDAQARDLVRHAGASSGGTASGFFRADLLALLLGRAGLGLFLLFFGLGFFLLFFVALVLHFLGALDDLGRLRQRIGEGIGDVIPSHLRREVGGPE